MEPKSGVLWLKIGDNNTKFFHCRATQRHRKNFIRGIMDEFNTWRTQPQDIVASLINDYQDLFSTSNLDPHWPSLDQIPLVITEEMNSILIATFQVCEVKEALKQMAPLKASGLDGMPPLFYQHFWGVVEKDVTTSVLSWLNSSTIPHSLNHTFVTLIPKTKNPKFVRDNRLSVCVMSSIRFSKKF